MTGALGKRTLRGPGPPPSRTHLCPLSPLKIGQGFSVSGLFLRCSRQPRALLQEDFLALLSLPLGTGPIPQESAWLSLQHVWFWAVWAHVAVISELPSCAYMAALYPSPSVALAGRISIFPGRAEKALLTLSLSWAGTVLFRTLKFSGCRSSGTASQVGPWPVRVLTMAYCGLCQGCPDLSGTPEPSVLAVSVT